MFKFGMPTLIEAPSADECVQLCKSLGLTFVELNMNLPEYQPDRLPVARLQSLAKKAGLFYTLHLDENFNPFDFNPYIAEAWLKTLKESISIARELECPVINLHLTRGVYFTLPEKRVYLLEHYREQFLASVLHLRELCHNALSHDGMRICIENTDGFLPFQQEAIDLLLQSPVFALTYDVGHDFGSRPIDKDFILCRRKHLRHMHLHDASSEGCHLPLGEGLLNKPALLNLAKQHNCTVVLETKTVQGLRHSLAWLASEGLYPENPS